MSEKRTDWGSLILGLLFIIVALFSFNDPIGNLLAIVIVFAVFAVLKGIFELVFRNKLKELTGYRAYSPIVVGILDIAIGIFLFFNLDAGILALPFVFAVWFIVDSVFGLFHLPLARKVSTGYYWFMLIVGVLGVFLGIVLLVNPLSAALTLSFLVGFYFMMFGVSQIVYAFR